MAKLSQRLGRSWRYKAKKEATTGRRTGGLAAGPTKRARKRQATPKRSSPVRLSSNCSRNLRRCASSTAGYCGMRFALFFHHWINRSPHLITADDLDGSATVDLHSLSCLFHEMISVASRPWPLEVVFIFMEGVNIYLADFVCVMCNKKLSPPVCFSLPPLWGRPELFDNRYWLGLLAISCPAQAIRSPRFAHATRA
eukprot:scpid53197/ scgid6592/ 